MSSLSHPSPAVPPLEHPLDEGWTLPASWYSDAGVAALERERIFARTLAVRRPGGAGRRARLVHGDAGGPHPDRRHARSRGRRCAASSTSAATARTRSPRAAAAARRCSARTTRGPTSSTARSARHPARSARRASTAADFSLLPVSVDTWGPFLFVNPDPDAAPLAEALGELPAIVARSGLDLSTLAFHSHHECADRRELEGRARELPRVLPLPHRPSRLQQGDRRRPGLLRADDLADVLEPDRADQGVAL